MSATVDHLLFKRPAKKESTDAGHRPTVYLTCLEYAFLTTAFGPDYLDGEVDQAHFLEAFRVGTPAAQTPVS